MSSPSPEQGHNPSANEPSFAPQLFMPKTEAPRLRAPRTDFDQSATIAALGTQISGLRQSLKALRGVENENEALTTENEQLRLHIEAQEARHARELADVEQQANAKIAELEHGMYHDHVTGVLNRRGFFHYAQKMLQDLQPEDSLVTIFADLNKFKAVNDTYGHAAGDETLTTVANALREVEPEHAVVARHGGDEFVILKTFPKQLNPEPYRSSHDYLMKLREQCQSVLPRLRNDIEQFGVALGASETITYQEILDVSHGIASVVLDELLEQAEKAMYSEKSVMLEDEQPTNVRHRR